MIANPKRHYITPEDYLQHEEQSLVKHEYIDGQVYAMAGASDPHVTVSGNLFALLRSRVRGTGCRVFISDMKAHIEALNIFCYPDVIVTCDARDREFSLFKRYPCLIVEVLSKSTEAFDRGDKFADYQHLETLQEYVLISTTRQRVDCFRRNAEGLWVLHPFTPNGKIHLASVDFQVGINELYEDVTLSQAESSEAESETGKSHGG
ncbi:MAG: Uma2 family endonuclease [Leptolyngbyaceae cyanobacterium RU_5_1]|nr:Uma2 family endonuclease [Leptolyngbyaceae cyanobacterium RU_5_1]